ncbi:MAG: VOC family protein [Oscillospiraceae bacterium]|nr:VOC family protein [Oscillospiraceae bacterium]
MARPVNGIHHIAIHAVDIDRTVEFYKTVFGFTHDMCWGEPGNRAVMLHTGDGSRVEIFENGCADAPEGAWCHLALDVNDCDAVFEAAVAAGCTVQTPPKSLTISGDIDRPVRIAFVKGFNGEVIEFFQTL